MAALLATDKLVLDTLMRRKRCVDATSIRRKIPSTEEGLTWQDY
jgi:hypothetical protein